MKEYIKVRDVKAGETGWAIVEGDKFFLDNNFTNYEVDQETALSDARALAAEWQKAGIVTA